MEINIRFATKEDIPFICKIYVELFSFTEGLQPLFWKKAEQDKDFLDNIIADSKSDIIVAQANNEIIGFALVQEQETLPYNCIVKHRYAHLMDIAVTETFRNQGVGKMLLNRVTVWANEHGLDYVELNVLSNNIHAIKFYERNGYDTTLLTMKHMLKQRTMFYTRTATIADMPALTELYKNTVLSINRKDYSAEEVEDWASCGEDTAHLHELFTEQHFIVAEDEKSGIVGFASINDTGYLHNLFVHKDFQHQGIATLLYNSLEQYVKEKGVERITSEVSITARPFFEKQGFVVDEEQKRKANQLCLINYKMSKQW